MAGLIKTVVRYTVIGTLLGGAVVVIAGPDRAWALVSQTRNTINGAIDAGIKDPVALRAQLRDLESQYPKRIGAVRGDLAEVNEQITQLHREMEVSKRVVAIADSDLGQMQGVLATAEQTRLSGGYEVVKVRFDDQSMSMDEAYAKANRVGQLRAAYSTKVTDIDRDLGYLGQQRDRLAKLLDKLEKERASFQTQLWNLDRQVDTIARNDRLITLMQDRQRTIDEQSRYHAGSLDHITARFADIRAKQEARLEMFSQTQDMDNYEDIAKTQLDFEASKGRPFAPKPVLKLSPSVIEIGPNDVPPTQDENGNAKQVVSRGG